MNKIFKISAMLLAGMFAFASCQEEPVLRLTDVGPEMTINSYTESTYMGAGIKFSVNITDKDFALSTLKATLYYDETEVNSVTIRTKEEGLYEETISAPLLKEIPDGTATLVLQSQNVGMGITDTTLYVELARPNFDKMILQTKEGNKLEMAKVDDYKYELKSQFPEYLNAYVVTPAINDEGEVVTLGWDGSNLSVGHANPVPFSAGIAGEFTVSVDLNKLTVSPLGSANVSAVYELKQGQVMDFGGIVDLNNWTIDYDYFIVNKDFTEVKFRAVDGFYRLSYDIQKEFVKVEPVDSEGNLLSLAADGSGAPWVIGANFGKPVIGQSWNTTDGAYPMAQIADKVYQFTLTAPGQIAVSGGEIKFFHQKGWGGEFTKADFAEINIDPAFKMTDSGNIQNADTEALSYKFTLDLTGGVKAAKVSCDTVTVPVNMLDIRVNGVQAKKMSKTVYKVMAVKVEKGDAITFSGIDNPGEWYADPDHFTMGGEAEKCPECGQLLPVTGDLKFNAVDGYYSFELDLTNKFVIVRRVKEDGKAATFKDEGAITLMGWGVAHPVMTNQVGFEGGLYLTLAEIEDGVYQFSGLAVEEKDGTTLGGRWRYDYLSFKFFGQAGWGDEQASDLTLTAEAQKYLKQSEGSNVELAADVKLEKGAAYVMTVEADNTGFTGGKFDLSIDFVKK